MLFLWASLLSVGWGMVAPAYSAEGSEETPPPTLDQGGAGDLLVAPTRVVLEARTRAAEIILNNKGAKEATYRISFTHLRMGSNGAYQEISEDEAKNTLKIADDLIRYSPRQVTLKPGESQVVKVMLRKPEGLADGEYTSHMLFRAVPELATGEDVEAQKSDDGKISIRLIPVYGVSIPIVVRQGDLSAQAKLTNASVANNTLSITIARTGNKSVFGDIIVSASGSHVIGQLRGINVMSYSDSRVVSLPLSAPAPFAIEYREREEDGGKVLDKIEIK